VQIHTLAVSPIQSCMHREGNLHHGQQRQRVLRSTLVLVALLSIPVWNHESQSRDELPQDSGTSAHQAPFDVDAVIRQVHFAYRPEPEGWRGGHSTYEVKATPLGFSFTPFRYRESEAEALEVERGAPLFLGTPQVVRGQRRLSVEAPRGEVEADGHLAFVHDGVVEHLRNSEQGVEQSWSFEATPSGEGELQVRIPVKGLVHAGTSERGLHFADARTGFRISYGHGTWVDGQGRRTAVPAEYGEGEGEGEGHILLRVPEEVLAASAYPAVLDPVISFEMIVDGRLVAADASFRAAASVAFNGTNFLVTWRNARAGQFDIYGTRVSSTGTLLDPTGIVVGNTPGVAGAPHVASNGTDFYVVWSELYSQTYSVRGTRVTSSGEVSTPGGTPLSAYPGSQHGPRVASNGQDYLVAWYMNGTDGYFNIYGKRVSSTGQLLDTAELPISTGLNYNETLPSVASNGTVYLVAWSDERASYPRAYAARVSNAGVVLDGTGFALSVNFIQTHPMVASNGTGFLAVWLDHRNVTSRDLYGARVTGSGTVVDASGFAVATTVDFHESYPAVASNGTDYFAAWTEWDALLDTYQSRGSRISASALASSAALDVPSLALSASGGAHKYPSVAPGSSGYLVAWEGASGTSSDLYNAWVSTSGTVTSGSGFPMTTISSLYQVEPAIASNGSNYLVVWRETVGSTIEIRGARVSRQGGTIDPSGLVIASSIRERAEPAVASDGTNYLVAWMDFRNQNWDIHGARVNGTSASANAVQDPNGIVISADSAFQNQPSVASDGTDYLVVWRQDPSTRGDIYGARVSSGGVVLDTSGIAISTNLVEHYTPRVTSNGTDYFAAWSEYRGGTQGYDIYGARVTSGGVVLDTSGIAVTTATEDQYEPGVASDGTNYLVAWTDTRSGSNNDIYGVRVSSAGAIMDTADLAICTETVQQHAPVVAFDGTSYVVAWADYRLDSWWDVYATQVTSSGTVTTPNGFNVAYNVRDTEPGGLSLASAGAQQSMVVYSRYDEEPYPGNRRIFGNFFSF
jgi:hypothetical protein